MSPSSENETAGSLSSVTFGPDGTMTIDYLDENGLGRFVRR